MNKVPAYLGDFTIELKINWLQDKQSGADYNSLRQAAVRIIAGCQSYDFLKTNLNFLSFGVNKLAPVSF